MWVTSSVHRMDLIQCSQPGAYSHKTNVVGDPYSRQAHGLMNSNEMIKSWHGVYNYYELVVLPSVVENIWFAQTFCPTSVDALNDYCFVRSAVTESALKYTLRGSVSVQILLYTCTTRSLHRTVVRTGWSPVTLTQAPWVRQQRQTASTDCHVVTLNR